MSMISLLLTSVLYIFNAATQQYLTIDDTGRPQLSATPVTVSLPDADDAGLYHIAGTSWLVKPTTAGLYTIGYCVADANAVAFVYVSRQAGNQLATTYAEPAADYAAGLWQMGTADYEQGIVSLDQDRTTYTTPTLYRTNKVTLHRVLAQGEWNSMCLPFSLTMAQIRSTWGSKTQVAQFDKFDDSGRAVFAPTEGGISAGIPCIIQVQQTTADQTYTFDGIGADGWAYTPTPVTHDGWSYTGSFAFIHPPLGAYVFGAGDKIYRVVSDKVNLRGFRAYFVSTGATPQQVVWCIDGTTTSIDGVTTPDNAPSDIYHIDGTLVRSQATSVNGLPKGVYLKGGKKIIIH